MKTLRACSLAFAALGGAAQAAPVDETDIEQLQLAWLQCDRLASTSLVDPGEAAVCSAVHESLLRRRFGGDFGRMLSWWRAQRAAAAQPAPPATARRP